MKHCPRCAAWKELGEFSNNRAQKDGKSSECRACRSAYDRTRKRLGGGRYAPASEGSNAAARFLSMPRRV